MLFALGCGEVAFWWRTVRHRRVQTGAEAIIGSDATVLSACRPDGDVWLAGARWRAHCEEGADIDDVVTVADRNELTLIVERPRRKPRPPDVSAEGDAAQPVARLELETSSDSARVLICSNSAGVIVPASSSCLAWLISAAAPPPPPLETQRMCWSIWAWAA